MALWLAGFLPQLQRLALEGNVVTGMPFYREMVLGICSSPSSARGLLVLDGVKVTAEEQAGVRVQFRQACGQVDLLRCNELRVCVLEHVCADRLPLAARGGGAGEVQVRLES